MSESEEHSGASRAFGLTATANSHQLAQACTAGVWGSPAGSSSVSRTFAVRSRHQMLLVCYVAKRNWSRCERKYRETKRWVDG